MISRPLTLSNRLGLHARAASKLVQTTARFDSAAWLSHGDKRVNAKSIMGVLLLGAPCGSELIAEFDGEDEAQALEALEALVNDRFGEEQ
ncbi:HPr family phosphocarrier protein [Wenzhouxiangella limi]|uniref:HPr family phosphocarrier protein n=1 Tax=Wenzhouxiangella limi TaxID=2707351 RepID=A0A845V7E6_9GAMM|nr:HPr family phosphocarrier protein [Wenzhouxiangella limi]NDY96101.1 HPr family phosphocarrier protein [Wenzhouxiangella limi]